MTHIPKPKFHLIHRVRHIVGWCDMYCPYCDYNFHLKRSKRPGGNPEKLGFVFHSAPSKGHVHGKNSELSWSCDVVTGGEFLLIVRDHTGAIIDQVHYKENDPKVYPKPKNSITDTLVYKNHVTDKNHVTEINFVEKETEILDRIQPDSDMELLAEHGFTVKKTKYPRLFLVIRLHQITFQGSHVYAGITTKFQVPRFFQRDGKRWIITNELNRPVVSEKKYLKNLTECAKWLEEN